MYRTFLSLALVTLLSASASAASVGFLGEFASETLGNGTGFLGAGPFPVAFSAFEDEFEFSEGAAIGILQNTPDFTIGGATVWATSGTAAVTDAAPGLSDSVQFVLNISTTGPVGVDGQFTMTFTGVDLISNGSVVNQANFSELMNYPDGPFLNGNVVSASTGITYTDFSTANVHSYAGTAFAVPEPGSLLCLAALGCVGIMRRRRS